MKRIEHTVGTDNVFADLGLEDSEEYLQKATLAVRINEIVADMRLTQEKAAAILGIDQPKVSLLKRGLLDGFSIERLMRFLSRLGRPQEVTPMRKGASIRKGRLPKSPLQGHAVRSTEHQTQNLVSSFSRDAGITYRPLIKLDAGSEGSTLSTYSLQVDIEAQTNMSQIFFPGFMGTQVGGQAKYGGSN